MSDSPFNTTSVPPQNWTPGTQPPDEYVGPRYWETRLEKKLNRITFLLERIHDELVTARMAKR